MKKLFFALVLPLAACFDADMTLTINDKDTATVNAVMEMGPELYGMIAASGEDPCDGGVGAAQPDGGFICTVEETDTIDNLIAELQSGGQDAQNPMDMGGGVAIERLEDGNVKVSFDLARMSQDIDQQGLDPQMLAGMQQAFTGRNITLTVAGFNIVESNGTLSEDGTSATMQIPLVTLFDPNNTLPVSFDVVVDPD